SALQSLRSLSVRVLASADELPDRSVNGWIFANEVYDSLPVSRVVGAVNGGLEELRVGLDGERFAWVRLPLPEPLRAHVSRRGIELQPDQLGEISIGAAALHRRLARAIKHGRLVAFDYGHSTPVLYHPLAR